MTAVRDRALAFVLVGALVALALHKAHEGTLPEMLWACHPSAALLALGILSDMPLVASVGGLTLVALGIPGWAFELAASHTTTLPSAIIHVLGAALGVAHARRRGLPPVTVWLAVGLWCALVALARVATPPALDVNLAFHPFRLGPWRGLPQPLSIVVHVVNAALFLVAARWLVLRRAPAKA